MCSLSDRQYDRQVTNREISFSCVRAFGVRMFASNVSVCCRRLRCVGQKNNFHYTGSIRTCPSVHAAVDKAGLWRQYLAMNTVLQHSQHCTLIPLNGMLQVPAQCSHRHFKNNFSMYLLLLFEKCSLTTTKSCLA